MDKFSDIVVKENGQWVKQIDFIPDLTYCGGDGYTALLTTLTYNIPKPNQLHRELTYDNSNQIIIKKEDGTMNRLDGIPNKYVLYGYIEDKNSLVQLDVSNYNIDNEGILSFTNKKTLTKVWDLSKVADISYMALDQNFNDSYKWTVKCRHIREINGSNQVTVKKETGGMILWSDFYTNVNDQVYKDRITQAVLQVDKINPDFVKNAECTWKFKIRALGVHEDVMSKDNKGTLFNFVDQDYDNLYTFLTDSDNAVLIDTEGNAKKVPGGVLDNDKVVAFSVEFSNDGVEYVWDELDCVIQHPKIDPTYTHTIRAKYTAKINKPVIFLIEYVSVEVQYTNDVTYKPNTLVLNYPVVDYGYYEKNSIQFGENNDVEYEKYKIKDCYKNTQIVQTSITLNDLQYIPNPTGHRLYIKPNLVKYDTSLNNKVYYRYLDTTTVKEGEDFGIEREGDCVYETTKDKNCLYLFTGPCFTPNTLTS